MATEWQSLFREARLRSRAHAVAARTTAPLATFSHQTAAALHRLPLYRGHDDRVDLVIPGLNARRSQGDVIRHHQALTDDDVEVIDGLRTTTLSRTVYDVIRTSSLETAVACADAAMRRVAWNEQTRSYDQGAAELSRRVLDSRIRAHTGARGIRTARFVAEFADGRAQLPGESIARLWMHQLGVARPQLQLRVELGLSRYALLDFAWPDLGLWAEFDGEVKYTDAAFLQGRSADEVREAQVHRERQIVQATGWRVGRWGFERMASIDAFAAYLRSIGL